jgi:hypothetical protein
MFNAKKIATSLAAAALMMGVSSSAFAAFADLDLIRIVYDRAGSEIATDLGSVKTIAGTTTIAGAGGTFAGSFGSLTEASSYVVYFALDRVSNELWATGSTTTPSLITGTSLGLTGMKSGSTFMYNWYNGNSDGTNYTGLASATNSYKNKLSSTQGNMAAAIAPGSRLNTEASLATIATAPITQTLYYWASGLATTTAGKTGTAVATITTFSDGHSTVTPTATPIPAAIYLMGSGLLGLVGIRRRKNA